MIKDNHISVAGGIANAMKSVDQFLEMEKLKLPVEVLFGEIHLFIFYKKSIAAFVFISFFVHLFVSLIRLLHLLPVEKLFVLMYICSDHKRSRNHCTLFDNGYISQIRLRPGQSRK